MKKNNNRRTRINDEIQLETANILRELQDPRIATMTSVIKVETTSDLSNSKVYVSVLGTEEEKKKVMEGLKSASGFIRHELAVRINLRNTPQLKFVLDNAIEQAVRLDKLIDEANNTNSVKETK